MNDYESALGFPVIPITDAMLERARRAYVAACNDERPQADSLGVCLRAALMAALGQGERQEAA